MNNQSKQEAREKANASRALAAFYQTLADETSSTRPSLIRNLTETTYRYVLDQVADVRQQTQPVLVLRTLGAELREEHLDEYRAADDLLTVKANDETAVQDAFIYGIVYHTVESVFKTAYHNHRQEYNNYDDSEEDIRRSYTTMIDSFIGANIRDFCESMISSKLFVECREMTKTDVFSASSRTVEKALSTLIADVTEGSSESAVEGRVKLGSWLARCVEEACVMEDNLTPVFFTKTIQEGKNRSVRYTFFTDDYATDLDDRIVKSYADSIEGFDFMVCKPRPWRTTDDGKVQGGWLTRQIPMMKRLNPGEPRRMPKGDLTKTLDTLNMLQETPFVLNKYMLETRRKIKALDAWYYGIPQSSPFVEGDLSDSSLDLAGLDINDTTTTYHIGGEDKTAAEIAKQEIKKFNDRFGRQKVIEYQTHDDAAERMLQASAEFGALYMPWQIDSGGRYYQHNFAGIGKATHDVTKCLLMMASPVAATEVALRDLQYMIGHCLWDDKATPEDKIAWAKRKLADGTLGQWVDSPDVHVSEWLGTTGRPGLVRKDWLNKETGETGCTFKVMKEEPGTPCDEPWYGLACAQNLVAIDRGDVDTIWMEAALDAKSSAIQLMTLAFRDHRSAAFCGLDPDGESRDIYKSVASGAWKRYQNDLALYENAFGPWPKDSSVPCAGKLQSEMAGLQDLFYEGGSWTLGLGLGDDLRFNRTFGKRITMCIGYSLTPSTGADYQQSEVWQYKMDKGSCLYCSNLLFDSIEEEAPVVMGYRNWVQALVPYLARQGVAPVYRTPGGLTLTFDYTASKTKRINIPAMGRLKRDKLTLNWQTGKLDPNRLRTAICPRLIHSLDASVITLMTAALREAGCPGMTTVHDAYYVPCGYMEVLREAVLQAMKEVAEFNPFGKFAADMTLALEKARDERAEDLQWAELARDKAKAEDADSESALDLAGQVAKLREQYRSLNKVLDTSNGLTEMPVRGKQKAVWPMVSPESAYYYELDRIEECSIALS